MDFPTPRRPTRAIEVLGGNGPRVHWIVDGLGSREACLLSSTSSNFLFMMGIVEDCKSFEDVVDESCLVLFRPQNVLPGDSN